MLAQAHVHCHVHYTWIVHILMYGGGALTWSGGTGMTGGQDPLFMPLLPFLRPHLQHFSVLCVKIEKCLTPTRENCQKFKEFSALQHKFAQILVHKPSKCWQFLSSLDLTFARNQFFWLWFGSPCWSTQTKVECSLLGQIYQRNCRREQVL